MKKILLCLMAVMTLSFVGCVSNSKYEELYQQHVTLQQENKDLLIKLDKLENGEERIVNLIRNSYDSKKYIKTNDLISTLKKEHPESPFLRTISKQYPNLPKQIKAEQDNIEKVRRDSIRLANINNLGIWSVGHYVDDFGEPTKEGYISATVFGTFSNSATTDSNLRVEFLIDKNSIRIQLYEYAGNHPVKGEGIIDYVALDSNGKRWKFKTNNGDNGNNSVCDFSDSSYEKVKKLLLSGGRIKFIATADRYGSPSEYKFTIKNADFLENAFTKMELQK